MDLQTRSAFMQMSRSFFHWLLATIHGRSETHQYNNSWQKKSGSSAGSEVSVVEWNIFRGKWKSWVKRHGRHVSWGNPRCLHKWGNDLLLGYWLLCLHHVLPQGERWHNSLGRVVNQHPGWKHQGILHVLEKPKCGGCNLFNRNNE